METRIAFHEFPKGFMDGLMKAEYFIRKSGIELSLLELVKVRVSQINGCAYCLDMHYKDAVAAGETPQRLLSLSVWRECPYYADKERAVLAFAEALTYTDDKGLSDEHYNDIARFFDKGQIAWLTLAVTQINSWNRINKVFRPVPGTYEPGQFAGLSEANQ